MTGLRGTQPRSMIRHLSDRVDGDRFVIVEEFADEIIERHGNDAALRD